MNKKQKLKIVFLALIALALISIGTYAYYYFSFTGKETNLIKAGCLKVEVASNDTLDLTNQVALTDEEGMAQTPYVYTLTNNCNLEAYYETTFNVLNTSTESNASKVKISLSGDSLLEPIIVSELEEVTLVDAPADVLKSYIIDRGYLAVGEIKQFNLNMWIDYDTTEFSGNFDARVIVDSTTRHFDAPEIEYVLQNKTETDVKFTINAKDEDSEIVGYYVSKSSVTPLSGADGWQTSTGTSIETISYPLENVYYIWVKDETGLVSEVYRTQLVDDIEGPVFALNGSASKSYANETTSLTIPIKVTEELTEIIASDFIANDITVKVGSTTVTPTTKTLTYKSVSSGVYSYDLVLNGLTGNGALTLNFADGVLSDTVGNANTSTTLTTGVVVDNTIPTCGTVTGASTTWVKADRTITQACTDTGGSGCAKTSYATTFTETARFGTITIADNAGNSQTCSVNVYVDKTVPYCYCYLYSSSYVNCECIDYHSGFSQSGAWTKTGDDGYDYEICSYVYRCDNTGDCAGTNSTCGNESSNPAGDRLYILGCRTITGENCDALGNCSSWSDYICPE